MKEKNREPNTVDAKDQNEIKDDNGNTLRSTGGPNVDRLVVAVVICVTLLIAAKLLGL